MSDLFDQIDATKNPNIDEDIRKKYVDQVPGAPEGFEQPSYLTEIADQMIAQGGDPEETIARLNSAHFLSRQLGISLEEAYDNYDAVSEEYFGRATPPASTVEAIANTYKAAEIGTQVAELAYQLMEQGGESPELQKRMEELYAQMPPEDTIKRSLGTKALKAAAQFIPSQARSFSAGAWEGMAVAGAGAALASPAAATGLGALSIPTIATLGFTVGSAHGSVEKARQLEAGALYADLIRYKDPITGERINPQVAATAAKVYGGMAAVVELFQAESFFKQFPGLRQAAQDAIVDKAAKAARAGVVQRQLFKLAGEASSTARDTAADIIGNTAEETLQELLNIGAEEFAKQVTDRVDGTTLTPATQRDIQDRIVETMVGTAIGMGVLSGIPSGARLLVGGAQAGAGAAKVAAIASEEEKGASGASATEGDLALFKKRAAESVPDDAHIQAKEEIEGELYTLKMGSKTADEKTGKGKRYGFVRYSVDQENESVTIDGFGRDAEPSVNLALVKNLMARYPGWEINLDARTPMQAAMKQLLTEENPRGPEAGLQWFATPAMKNRTMTYDYIRKRIQEQKPGWAKDEVEFSVRFLDTLARPMGMSGEELADATFAPGIFGTEGARTAAQGATGSISIIHMGEELRTVINLAKDANPSTWMHEAVHAATLFAVENRGRNEKIESFVGELEGLLGVQNGDWYSDVQGWAAEYKGAKNAHEALAYAIEDYFLTGEVPDPKVKNLFHRIAKWLVDLYKTITAERYKVSPELKAYMDRLFATPESPLYELATTMGEDDVKSPAVAQSMADSKPAEETRGITQEEPQTQQRPDIEEPEIYQKRDVMERSARESLKDAQEGRDGTGWSRSKWDGEWRYSQPAEGASAEKVVQEQARRGDVPAVDGIVPSLYARERPARLFQAKEVIHLSQEEASAILDREKPIPGGWYVHGRSPGVEFVNDSWPTMFSNDIETAKYYGRRGSVWMAIPSDDAVVLDFEGMRTPDMNRFMKNMEQVHRWYQDELLDSETYEAYASVLEGVSGGRGIPIDELGWDTIEEALREEFTPEDIVDTARAYDSADFLNLLQFAITTRSNWPDFIKTPDGAVLIPGSDKVVAVNLTEDAGAKELYQGRVEGVEAAVDQIAMTLENEGIAYTVKTSRSSYSRYIEAEIAGAPRWIRVSDHHQGQRSRMRGTVGFDAVLGENWAPAFFSWLGKMLDKEFVSYEDRPRDMKTTDRGIATTELFQIKDLNHGAKAGFEAFDHTFMGSGEGQQVYGWGTYLTENRGVARDNYAKRLGEEFELLFNVDQPQPGSFSSKTRDPGYRRIFEAMKKEITAAGPEFSLDDQAGIKRIVDKAIEVALREAEYEDDTTGNGAHKSVKIAADRMRELVDSDRPMQIRKGRWLYTVDVETKGKRKAKAGAPAGASWDAVMSQSDLDAIADQNKWSGWGPLHFMSEYGQTPGMAAIRIAESSGIRVGDLMGGTIENLRDIDGFMWRLGITEVRGSHVYKYLKDTFDSDDLAYAVLSKANYPDIYPGDGSQVMLDAGSLKRGEADLYSHIGDGAMDPNELVDFAEAFYDDDREVPEEADFKIALLWAAKYVMSASIPGIEPKEIDVWADATGGVFDYDEAPDNMKAHIDAVTTAAISGLDSIKHLKVADTVIRAAEIIQDYWGGPDDEPHLFLVANEKTPKPTPDLETDGRWLRWDKPLPEEDWQDVFEVIGQLRDAVADQNPRVEYVLKEENRFTVANFTNEQLYGSYPTESEAKIKADEITKRVPGADVRVVDGFSEEGRKLWDPENKRFDKGDFFTLSSDYFEKRLVEDEKFAEVVGKIFGDNAYDMELAEDFEGKMDELEMSLPQFESWEENTGSKPTGKDLYNVLAEILGNKYASILLSGVGFDGVTYPVAFLTGGSGDRGMNYVVFNDKAIKIAKRVLFQPAHADGSRSSQEGNLDDPGLASIKDIARQFSTWQEFAEDMEIPFNDELRAMAGADRLDEEARKQLYKEVWEASSKTASFGSDIDLWVKSLEANNGQGVVEFLETIWDEILSGAMFDYQPLDEDEAEIITKRRARAERVRSEIAEVVKAAAIRLGAKGKRPSDRMIASILGVIRKNPEEYARIYAEVYDIPELLETAQTAVEQKYADIEDPRFKTERLSISQKAAMAKIIENEELGRAIMRGDVVVEKDVLEYIKGLQAEGKALTNQADRLKAEISEDNKLLSRWEKRWIEASTKIGQMDAEIKKIDSRIQTLAKDNRRIPQSLIDEGNSLKRIRETMIRQRDRAQREVGNPAKLQTKLAKIEEAARIKLSAKARDMKIRAARDLRAYQRKLARQIMKPVSDQVAIQQQRAIRNIQAMIDPERRSDRTMEQIEALRKELEKNPALAAEIPREWLNRATKKNLSEMSLKELEEIAEVVKGLRAEGRAVFKRKEDARKEADRASQDHIADLLLHLPGAAAPGEKPDPNSAAGRFVSKLREADYSFTNAQRFARMMDGSSGGPNYELLILERDRMYRKEMTEVDRRTKRIMDAFEREGVSPESWYDTEVTISGAGPGRRDKVVRKSDIAALELAFRNEDSRAAALFGNFFSHYEKRTMNEEELFFEGSSRFQAIRDAIDSALTDRDLRILETFAADGDETGERLVETVGEVENKNMETVDNYFPINREGVTGDPIDKQIAVDVLNRTPGLKRPPKNGFTKSRVNISPKNQTPIKLDLLTTWMHSIQATEHYIANAAYGKRLNGVYLNNFMQEALRAAMGDEGVKYLKHYIAEVINPGELRNVSRWDNSIKWLRGNLGAAYLGFRASSVLKQFITSPWPALAYAGPRLLGETFHCLANPVRFVRETEALSIVLKHRTADLVMDAVKRANATSPTGRKIQKVNQVGMMGLEIADRVSVAIGWRAIYEKELAAHGDIQKAIETADDITLKTQPSSRGVDLAPIYREKGEAYRLLLQFTSAMNVIWQNIRHDVPSAIREKNYLQGVGIITSYAIAGTLLSLATEGDEDDEDRGKLLAFYAITQGTESIPLIGQDVTRFARKVITGDAGYDFPDTALPGAAQVFDGLTTIAKDPDNWERGLKQFSAGVGIIAGAPVSGVKEGARALSGDFGALIGKPRSD